MPVRGYFDSHLYYLISPDRLRHCRRASDMVRDYCSQWTASLSAHFGTMSSAMCASARRLYKPERFEAKMNSIED
jgi:hypothetical protein